MFATLPFNKHVEILNHSVYPQHDTFIDIGTEESMIYKLVYNTIDFASIREPMSFMTIEKLGVKVNESFDCMPLYIKEHYTKSAIKHSHEVLVAGSATWLQLDILSNDNGNIHDFTQGLYNFNQYLQEMSTRGFTIKFLYGAQSYPAKDDREFIEYMCKQFSVPWAIYEAVSLTDWLRRIDEATFLVSGRFHHTIAAACLGTPFIALNSNTPKMDGLMQVLKTKEISHYKDPDIYSKLLNATHEILSFPSDLSTFKKYNYLDMLCGKAEKNFDKLRTR